MKQSCIAIKVNNLNKIYSLYAKPIDRLKETLNPFSKKNHKDFYALNNISFTINKGESIGIIGSNGSGKSTLLKILTGVLSATSGEIDINGKISALLELGAGFNMDYTGIENIYLNGTILGYSKSEMDDKLKRILDFADIGDFVYQPVKTYSSGMFVRLAFAVAINIDPEILIVDEALSVGDARFQQKCYRAMERLMSDKTVIIVSHDSDVIAKYCSRAIWIEKGVLRYDGVAKEALKHYQNYLLNSMEPEESNHTTTETVIHDNKYLPVKAVPMQIEKAGTMEAEIVKCGLFNLGGTEVTDLERGIEYIFAMDIKFKDVRNNIIVGFSVRNHIGGNVFAVNSFINGNNVDTDRDYCQYHIKFIMPPLNAGEYTISPAIACGNMLSHIQLCWLQDVIVFRIPRAEYELPGTIYIDKGKYNISICEENH